MAASFVLALGFGVLALKAVWSPSGGTDTRVVSQASQPGEYSSGGDELSTLSPGPEASDSAVGGSGGSSGSTGTRNAPAPRIQGGVITIGAIITLTGPFDGRPAENVLKAHVQMVNEQGGINGHQLRLIVYDDGFDATKGMIAAKRLVEQDKVFAVVGWLSPATEPQAAPYFASQGVPVIGGIGPPQEFGPASIFPANPDTSKMWMGALRFFCQSGAKKPAVVLIDLAWTDAMAAGINKGLETNCGLKPVSTDKVSGAEPDFSPYVIKWRAAGVDSIVAVIDPVSYSKLFNAARSQNWNPFVFTGGAPVMDAEGKPVVVGLDGMINVESEIFPYLHRDHPGVRRFESTVRRYAPTKLMNGNMELVWTAAQIFVEGMRRAGSEPDRGKLIRALDGLRDFKTDLSPPISYWPGNHDPIKCQEIMTWKDGGWKDVYDSWQCWEYQGNTRAVPAPSRPF